MEPPIKQITDQTQAFSQALSPELKTRIITAAVLVTGAALPLWLGGVLFAVLVVIVALLALREWDNITVGFAPHWQWGGLAYIAVPSACLLWLRLSFTDGAYATLALIILVAATDIGAYFAGRALGGPKLAPAISPGKTWAGLGGGALAAALVGAVMSAGFAFHMPFWAGLLAGALLAVTAQGGDLFESWLKRRAGVKDSGALLPGHGGVLDRIDGLLAAAPFFALLVYCCA